MYGSGVGERVVASGFDWTGLSDGIVAGDIEFCKLAGSAIGSVGANWPVFWDGSSIWTVSTAVGTSDATCPVTIVPIRRLLGFAHDLFWAGWYGVCW